MTNDIEVYTIMQEVRETITPELAGMRLIPALTMHYHIQGKRRESDSFRRACADCVAALSDNSIVVERSAPLSVSASEIDMAKNVVAGEKDETYCQLRALSYLSTPQARQALEQMHRRRLEYLGSKAIDKIEEIMERGEDKDVLNASKTILDRIGMTEGGAIRDNASKSLADMSIEELARLVASKQREQEIDITPHKANDIG